MRKNQPQPPIPDKGISRMTPLNLPCVNDLNHLRIKLSDSLNIAALIDHLETCEKCSQFQGEVVRDLNGLIGGGSEEIRKFLLGTCRNLFQSVEVAIPSTIRQPAG